MFSLATILFLVSPAHASAVAGCNFQGTVESVGETGVTMQVTTNDPFGHSGPPPSCPEIGSKVSFTPDNVEVLKTVRVGMTVEASELTVWNIEEVYRGKLKTRRNREFVETTHHSQTLAVVLIETIPETQASP